jgi:FtsP/CotA-like multicopper oxidase with cupredoxin domain
VAQPNLDFTASAPTLTIDRVDIISSGGQLLVGTNNIVGNAIPGSGQGYDPLNLPSVVFSDGACLPAGGVAAAAKAIVDAASRQVTGVVMSTIGTGYTCAPTVTFTTTIGVGAQATVHAVDGASKPLTQSILVRTKAEQELFDTFGRYNSTGGVELPLTSGTTQTTVPLSYIDAPTEILKEGDVQIWKIVDNGLWTNSMHFDFVDVQLINRVGWDGTVKAPASNEVGWKDTLRLNPLEDVIFAMRA